MTFYSTPNYSKYLHEWLKRGRNWHIEYGGYLSNHITHNWIALDAAGANQEKMQWWEDVYTNKAANKTTEATATISISTANKLEAPRNNPIDYTEITDANWLNNLQSIRIAFPLYRDFFDKKIAELGLSACLKRYYPALSEGMAGAALHATIHLGWAVDVDSTDMAAEGLAYMATAFQPLATGSIHTKHQLWSPDAPCPIQALKQILGDDRILQLAETAYSLSKTQDYKKLNRGGFQQRLITFDNPQQPMSLFLNEMVTLRLPAVGYNLTTAVEELSVIAASALRSSNNEFFILHGLTSLHAVLCVLPHLDENAQRNALGYWFRALIATIVIQGSPGIKDSLASLDKWDANKGKEKASGYQLSDEQKAWWLQTLKSTTGSLDEHVPKAVYVLKRWAEWQAFSSVSNDVYAKAARNVIAVSEGDGIQDNLWFSKGFSTTSQDNRNRYD
ncbi:hypothetical protein H4W00_002050 [Psychrobacter sp. PL19]|uniref:questin oxidase family protein n=1 Tax=Psychrobacter sp. PL19 TaxID=2760711 RepID=UPI001AE9AB16